MTCVPVRYQCFPLNHPTDWAGEEEHRTVKGHKGRTEKRTRQVKSEERKKDGGGESAKHREGGMEGEELRERGGEKKGRDKGG